MPVHLEVGDPQRRKREWRAALLFAIAGLILLPVYQTGFSPDTTAYLIVAEHYLHGRWDEAINGLWGPLASWLLAPFLGLGINGLTAFRFINLAAATGTLLAFRALATQLRVGPALVDIVSIGLAPYLYLYGLTHHALTPDLLLACFVLLYLLMAWRRPRTVKSACAAGLFAGIAYLAKAYALPFFLAHFTATQLADGRRVRKRGHARGPALRWLAGVGCFSLLAAPWAATLSRRYEQPTFATSGAYNRSFMHPDARHPIVTEGLIPPPGPNGLSAWDDPTLLPMPTWRWWHSAENFAVGLRKIAQNLLDVSRDFHGQAGVAYAMTVAAAAGALLFPAGWLRRRRREVIVMALTTGLFVSGYALTTRLMEGRYFVPAALLMGLCGLVLSDEVRRRLSQQRLALVLAGALAFGYALPASVALLSARDVGRHDKAVADGLAGVVRPGDRIASLDDWVRGLTVSFWLDAQFYGLTKPGDLGAQLREHKIDFLTVWRPESAGLPPPGKRVRADWDGPPAVYDLRERR